MKKNVGKTDKIIRIVLGLIIIIVGIYLKSWWGIVGAIIFTRRKRRILRNKLRQVEKYL